MNEDIQVLLKFKDVSGKKVTVDFTGGDVTSDAGVLALKEVAKKIGIIEHLVEAIDDDRHQSYVQQKIFAQEEGNFPAIRAPISADFHLLMWL